MTRDVNEGSYQAGLGWQTANVGTQRVVIEHAVRADKLTRITAVVDYNPGGGDFQQALVYVPDYGSTSNSATRLVSATTTGNGLHLTWPATGLASRADITVLQINIWAGPSGSAVIRSVTIEGEGYFEGQCIPDPQPTATPTPTATFTPTVTPTFTDTPTLTLTNTATVTLVPQCQAPTPANWQDSVVRLGISYTDGTQPEIATGTYIDLSGQNCILTTSHFGFQYGLADPTKIDRLYVEGVNRAVVSFPGSQVTQHYRDFDHSQSLFCLASNATAGITNPPLQAVTLAPTPANLLSNCNNGFETYIVHSTVDETQGLNFQPQLVRIRITASVHDFVNWGVHVRDGFTFNSDQVLAKGDSGSPTIVNGEIVGVYVGGTTVNRNLSAWAQLP